MTQDPSLHTQDPHNHPKDHIAGLQLGLCPRPWLCPRQEFLPPSFSVCAVAKGSPIPCTDACQPWFTCASLPGTEINDAGTAHWLWVPWDLAAKGQQLAAMCARS